VNSTTVFTGVGGPANKHIHQRVSLSRIGFHRSNFLPNYVEFTYIIIQRTR
jgi:hypothetical protein